MRREQHNRMTPEWVVHTCMLILQACLGLYHVLAKVALRDGVDQLVFCVWRDAIALALIAPSAWALEKHSRPPMTSSLMWSFVVLGATGILGNQLLFLIGLDYTGPATAAALQPSIPVFTFCLAVLLGYEAVNLGNRAHVAKVAGVVVCVCGAIVMATYRGPAVLPGTDGPAASMAHSATVDTDAAAAVAAAGGGLGLWRLGVLSLLGNCACMALYITLQAPVLVRYPAPLSVTALAYAAGGTMMLAMGLLLSSSTTTWLLTMPQLVAVLYAGVMNSAIGYCLLAWANKRVGPAVVALYTPLQPLSSALLSHAILGSSIFTGSVIGGILVLMGLYLVIWGKSSSTSPAAVAAAGEPMCAPSLIHIGKESDDGDGGSDISTAGSTGNLYSRWGASGLVSSPDELHSLKSAIPPS